jgi:hypothetical protein
MRDLFPFLRPVSDTIEIESDGAKLAQEDERDAANAVGIEDKSSSCDSGRMGG